MKKFLSAILATIMGGMLAVTPVFADVSCTCKDGSSGTRPETSILGESVCDCGHGEAVTGILELVVDILSVVIGVVGVLGIVIVGIQYLTAGGNEEQTRKAKRRIFEIVIGLAAYVLIYAFLKFLLPTFN